MKLGHVLTATDLNPLYADFIPLWVRAWRAVLPEAELHIVLIADAVPLWLAPWAGHIRLWPPLLGVESAFQAQCVRLLYPALLPGAEAVLITDMDMLPMSRRFYLEPIAGALPSTVAVYRPLERQGAMVSMCYVAASPAVWAELFRVSDAAAARELLASWRRAAQYANTHGGAGWFTDQERLSDAVLQWPGPRLFLQDSATGYKRLCRGETPALLRDMGRLLPRVQSLEFTDYHCLRPMAAHAAANEAIVAALEAGLAAAGTAA